MIPTDKSDLEHIAKVLDHDGYPHHAATLREAITRLDAWEDWAHSVTVSLQGLVHKMEWAPRPIGDGDD
jgi:hypothetical protein